MRPAAVGFTAAALASTLVPAAPWWVWAVLALTAALLIAVIACGVMLPAVWSRDPGRRRAARAVLDPPARPTPAMKAQSVDLARWIGASRETVERELAKLRSRGIITTAPRDIIVRDVQGLAARAGISDFGEPARAAG